MIIISREGRGATDNSMCDVPLLLTFKAEPYLFSITWLRVREKMLPLATSQDKQMIYYHVHHGEAGGVAYYAHMYACAHTHSKARSLAAAWWSHQPSEALGCQASLALPDPLRTGAYRLEIISAALRGSGTIHSPDSLLVTIASKIRLNFGLISSDAESTIST